jgi:RND family efflux transporter MFP subunit
MSLPMERDAGAEGRDAPGAPTAIVDPPAAVPVGESHTAKRRRWRWIVPFAAILAGAGALLAYAGRPASPPMTRAEGASAGRATGPIVAVTSVRKGSIARRETVEGEFAPHEQVDLRPRIGGFLQRIAVDEGDAVEQGQLLAVLEVPTLEDDIRRAQAQAQRDSEAVGNSKAAYDQAHQLLSRLLGVSQQQAQLIAQQEIDDARSRDEAATAAWKTALSQVEVAKAELAKLLALRSYCQVTAPFAGIVTRRFADPGTLVQGGVASGAQTPPLVTISRIDLLRLAFPISASLVPRIHVGSELDIAIGPLGEHRSGKVARFTQRIDNATRTMEVEADIANDGLRITPGMYATVGLVVERRDQVLVLPLQAISRRKSGAVAYVVDRADTIEERQIELGIEGPSTVEIRSGLADGERVVFGTLEKVKPGQTVTPSAIPAPPTTDP